ncbi:MAG: hypothetical protein WD030_04880, partial [Pirellulales bacterium]
GDHRGRQSLAPPSDGIAAAPQSDQQALSAFAEADASAERRRRDTLDEQVLLVRATRRQLEQTILELADHPDKVLSFALGEAPRESKALLAPAGPGDSLDAKLQDQQAAHADQRGPDRLREERRREAQQGLTRYFALQKSDSGDRAELERKQAFTAGGSRDDLADANDGSAATDGNEGFGGQIAGGEAGRAATPSRRGGFGQPQSPVGQRPSSVDGATAHAAPVARVQAMFVIRVMDDAPAADPASTREQPAGAKAAAEQP